MTEKPFAQLLTFDRIEYARRELRRAELFDPLPEAVWQAFDVAFERLALAINTRVAEIFGPWPVGMKVRIKTEYAARFVNDWFEERGPERLRVVVDHTWGGPPFYPETTPLLTLTPGVFYDQQYVGIPISACEPWPGACSSFGEGGRQPDRCAHCGDDVTEHRLDVSGPGQ